MAPHSELVENEYKGQKTMLPLVFKQCDACGSDFAGAAESKLNKRTLMAWRKQVDGLLTGEEITTLRKQYKITQAQAAKLFGGGPVAFTKYENDDVAQSEAMDTLLRVVRRSKETFWALVAEKGMESEFMGEPTMAVAQSNVIQFTARQSNDGGTDPRYNPRQLRSFIAGDKQWKQ